MFMCILGQWQSKNKYVFANFNLSLEQHRCLNSKMRECEKLVLLERIKIKLQIFMRILAWSAVLLIN